MRRKVLNLVYTHRHTQTKNNASGGAFVAPAHPKVGCEVECEVEKKKGSGGWTVSWRRLLQPFSWATCTSRRRRSRRAQGWWARVQALSVHCNQTDPVPHRRRTRRRLELTSLSLSVNLGLDSFTEGGLQTSRGDVRLLRNRRGYEFAPCCTSTLSSSFSANATEKKT